MKTNTNTKAAKAASDEENWQQVSSEFWSPTTKGDQITGALLAPVDSTYGATYVVDTGKSTIVLPHLVALNNRLRLVSEGSKVRITYKGVVTSANGRDYKSFDVDQKGGG